MLLKITPRIVPLTLLSSIASTYSTATTIATLCLALSACSTMHEPAVPTSAAAQATADERADAEQTVKEKLPNVDLTNEIFFKVVTAEIAFRRGDFADAFGATVSVAQQTRDPRLARRALEMALIAKQPAQAFYAARLWHDMAPESEEAMQYYAGFLVLNSDWGKLRTLLGDQLEQAAPKQRGAMMMQAERLLMRATDKEQAFNVVEQLVAPYTDMIEAHLALAQAAFDSSNNVRSMVEARAAQKIDPSSQIAVLTVAQASASPKESLQVMSDFLQNYPAATDVRRAYATLLIEQKQYAPARDQFDRLLAANPNDPGTLYTAGVLSLQLNDLPAAEKHLKAFVTALDSQNDQRDPTTAYLYLSQIADDRKDGAAALDWLAKIKSYEGKNAAYFNSQLRRALLMAKYGTLDQARDFLQQIPASAEEQAQVVQLDAELLRNAGRNQEALTVLEGAVKQYPDNPDLLYDYAMLNEKFDRINDMEKALRHVIEVSPNNQQAYNALGYSLADRNLRLPEARQLIEKALSMAPDDAFVIDSMGWLEFREGNTAQALEHLQRAYALRPDTEIAAHIGEVLWTTGQQKQARALLKAAHDKDPANDALKAMLLRLKIDL